MRDKSDKYAEALATRNLEIEDLNNKKSALGNIVYEKKLTSLLNEFREKFGDIRIIEKEKPECTEKYICTPVEKE